MMLNTQQAAEILEISKDRVKALIKMGALTDHRPIKEGSKKHYAQLDNKEVREYKKSEQYRTFKAVRYFDRNGHDVEKIEKAPQPAPFGQGIMGRLEQIEQKLDILLKLWS